MGIREKRPRKGLHICAVLLEIASVRSRPTRARGLKHRMRGDVVDGMVVAPHAGAWIETPEMQRAGMSPRCRAPRGRVD